MKTVSMSRLARRSRAARIITILKDLYPTPKSALHWAQPYEYLFAVIMSAQTTDKQVNKVNAGLFLKYKSLDDFLRADPDIFAADMSAINLYKNKAKYILATARILKDQYGGRVPDTMEELIKLPGAGRKTANVVLGTLYGKSVGITVDTHVIRLTRLYKLTDESTPEKIEKELMQILPMSEWIGFSNRLIWYGREYCPARCKSCPACPLWKAL